MLTYCLLDEAWGYKPQNESRYTTNQSCSTDLENSKEHSKESNNQSKKQSTETIEHFESDIMFDCEAVMEHLKKCKKCYNRISMLHRPMILDNFRDIINDNKDLIVLILIGISIVLFFNLINNLTKD